MKDIKHNKTGFSFRSSGSCMPQGLGLGGAGGSKIQFSEHGHVVYQIKGDEQ